MGSIELKSRAKINLSIDVLGKREDGYHLVEMIMQTIDLYDIIKIKETLVRVSMYVIYFFKNPNGMLAGTKSKIHNSCAGIRPAKFLSPSFGISFNTICNSPQ